MRTYIGGVYHGSVDHDLLAHDFDTDELAQMDALVARIEEAVEAACDVDTYCIHCGALVIRPCTPYESCECPGL